MPTIGFFVLAFLTLPVIGLYFSLRCRHYVSAFLLTLAVGLLGPTLLAYIGAILGWVSPQSSGLSVSFGSYLHFWSGEFIAQLVLAGFFAARLRRRLETRSFPLDHAL